MGDINKAVEWAIDKAIDDKHGYSQVNRNGPDYDCSSLVSEALNAGGFKVSKNSWTGNLYGQLIACGFILVNDAPKRGDIYLSHNPSMQHVVMAISNDQIVQATINENSGVSGGKTGDQTGREICISPFYIPANGWDFHFRYESDEDNKTVPLKIINVKAIELYFGCEGEAVCVLQTLLDKQFYDLGICGIDGEFGPDTENAVREYQGDMGLDVDGICGQNTWSTLLQRWLC